CCAARTFNDPSRALKDLDDVNPLQVVQRLSLGRRRWGFSAKGNFRCGRSAAQEGSFKFEYGSSCQNRRSFDDVLQLANVARPRVRAHAIYAARAEALDRFAELASETDRKESDEQTDIRGPLAERRHFDGENIEPVQQIGPKSS